MLSDAENVDIMLGSYSRDDENNMSENEANLDSGSSRPQQSSNALGEDFRSLLNTNSRKTSEITIETTRMINEEISNQISRKLNEIETNLNSQIQDAISTAITETALPSIQNTLRLQGRANFTVMDRVSNGPHPGMRAGNFTEEDQRSSGRQRNPEVGNSQKMWENRPKTCFTQEESILRSRESSVDSICSEQNRDSPLSIFLALCDISFEFFVCKGSPLKFFDFLQPTGFSKTQRVPLLQFSALGGFSK